MLKKIALIATIGLSFGAGLVFAQVKKHPNLAAALESLKQADAKITAAQKANEYDLGGHAAKAKDLIGQAIGEVKQAAQ